MFHGKSTFWKVYRVLLRIVGTGFICVGGVFIIWGLSLILDPKATLDVNGVPNSDPWVKASVLIVGLVVCVIGVLTFMARPYRQDIEKGDHAA